MSVSLPPSETNSGIFASIKVGNIATQVRGVTYSKDDAVSTPRDGYIPILRATNITDHGLTFDNLIYVPSTNVHPRQMLQQGDIVVATSSGSIDVVGKASIVTQPMIASFGAFCKVVRPGPHIHPSYLGHFFQTPEYRSIISKLAQGANINNLKNEHIDDLDIPLPSFVEQRQIATVLDRADTLCRHRRECLQLIEILLKSVFIKMFVLNPQAVDWTLRTVEWMAQDGKGNIRTGPFGSQLLHSEFVDSGIAVLGIDNAVKNRFEWGRPRFITAKKYQTLKRYKVSPGDLIITIMGTLGRCAVVPDDIPEAINTKHLCCITLNQKKCLPEFLHAAFLNHPDVLRQLGVRTKGAVMPGLNMGIIKDLKVPLPPLELQGEFKRIAELCTASQTDLEASQDAARELFSSIQQRAFRGKLDLSRITLDGEVPAATSATETVVVQSRYRRPGRFIAPLEVEEQMMVLEAKLDTGSGNSIAWDENYFKYRILSQILNSPFSFADIWREVEHDIEAPSYETVRDTVFSYIQDGTLSQQFDETLKEIVFAPRP